MLHDSRQFRGAAFAYALAAFLVAGCETAAQSNDPQVGSDVTAAPSYRSMYDTSNLDGFLVLGLDGQQQDKSRLTVDDGVVSLSYDRAAPSILAHFRTLTARFTEMRLRLRAPEGARLLVAVEDRDGDSFNAIIRGGSGDWQDVRLRPSDFRPDRAGGVRKSKLDTSLLTSGYVIVDITPRAQGEGVIALDGVAFDYEPLPVRAGPMRVDGLVELSEDVRIDGDVTIESGGVLRLTAERAVIAGDIAVERGGVFEVLGSTLHLPSQFAHQRHWSLRGDARFTARDAFLMIDHSIEVDTFDEALFELIDSNVTWIFTLTSNDQAATVLDGNEGSGEFIVCRTCPFTAVDQEFFLLWLTIGPEFGEGAVLTFPDGESVRSWSPDGWAVDITDSRDILWGLITAPGPRGLVRDSQLQAVASVYVGPGETRISGVHTSRLPAGDVLDTGDRALRFDNTNVLAWNFYILNGHDLIIEDSTIGESWGLDGTGTITARRTTYDGSGGTVRSRGQTQFLFEDVTVLSQVIAEGDASMRFVDSRIENTLSAVDNAVVTLVNTPVTGEVIAAPPARVVQE